MNSLAKEHLGDSTHLADSSIACREWQENEQVLYEADITKECIPTAEKEHHDFVGHWNLESKNEN